MSGKNFTEDVYEIVKKIPKGKVMIYSDVAKAIGKPKSARAVGNALGRNKNLVVIPCHRVLRSDGSLGGYAGGIKKKISLLQEEGVICKNKKVDLEKFLYFL